MNRLIDILTTAAFVAACLDRRTWSSSGGDQSDEGLESGARAHRETDTEERVYTELAHLVFASAVLKNMKDRAVDEDRYRSGGELTHP